MKKIFALYDDGKYAEVSAQLTQLSPEDPTVQTFQKFLEAEEAIAHHQQTLGLTIKEAQ